MNKITPLVSIVLPTYNGENFIAKAIESILKQTYTNFELVIVDDCSTDRTNQIINSFANKDGRIQVIRNDKNKKLPASLNIGFNVTKGEYYTWTSDDNEYHPEAIEKMVNFLNRNLDFGMVYARTNVEKNGEIEPYIWCDQPTTPETLLRLCVPGACFMYRADVAKHVGRYDEKAFLNEDHDYWLRILLHSNIWNLKDILYLYRITSDNLTNTRQEEIKKGKILLLRKYRNIYSKHFPEIKEIYKNELIFDKFIQGKLTFKECKKRIPKKLLYQYLKEEYLYIDKNLNYIKNIMQLGFIYFFKGLNLTLKYSRSKDVRK